jgi:hypothetical protein
MAKARPRKPGERPSPLALLAGLALGATGTIVVLHPGDAVLQVKDEAAAIGLISGCDIKGNISINSGERIYHVPGQMFYSDTIIRPEYGERWFCTEQEAIAAGWHKARR